MIEPSTDEPSEEVEGQVDSAEVHTPLSSKPILDWTDEDWTRWINSDGANIWDEPATPAPAPVAETETETDPELVADMEPEPELVVDEVEGPLDDSFALVGDLSAERLTDTFDDVIDAPPDELSRELVGHFVDEPLVPFEEPLDQAPPLGHEMAESTTHIWDAEQWKDEEDDHPWWGSDAAIAEAAIAEAAIADAAPETDIEVDSPPAPRETDDDRRPVRPMPTGIDGPTRVRSLATLVIIAVMMGTLTASLITLVIYAITFAVRRGG